MVPSRKGPATNASRYGNDSSSSLSKGPITIYLGDIILGEREDVDILMTLGHGVWVNINTQATKISYWPLYQSRGIQEPMSAIVGLVHSRSLGPYTINMVHYLLVISLVPQMYNWNGP